jgi:hypothetical protein
LKESLQWHPLYFPNPPRWVCLLRTRLVWREGFVHGKVVRGWFDFLFEFFVWKTRALAQGFQKLLPFGVFGRDVRIRQSFLVALKFGMETYFKPPDTPEHTRLE